MTGTIANNPAVSDALLFGAFAYDGQKPEAYAADFRALLADGADAGTAAVIAGWRETRCVNCGKRGKDFSRPLGCGGEVDVDCEWVAAD